MQVKAASVNVNPRPPKVAKAPCKATRNGRHELSAFSQKDTLGMSAELLFQLPPPSLGIHEYTNFNVRCDSIGANSHSSFFLSSPLAEKELIGLLQAAKLIIEPLQRAFGTMTVPQPGDATDPRILELTEAILAAFKKAGLIPSPQNAA